VKLHVALANIRLRHDTLFKMKVLCNHIALLKLTNFISTGKLYLKHSATYSSSPLLARIRMRLKFMDLILLWMFSLNDRVNILTLLCVFCNDIAWLTRGGKEQSHNSFMHGAVWFSIELFINVKSQMHCAVISIRMNDE